MKILCPVDFSKASINAFKYALKLGDFLGATLVEVTHCHYSTPGRKVGSPVSEVGALQDKLSELVQSHEGQFSGKIGSSFFKGDPLDVLSPYLKAMGHDLVVVGTRGLTQVRDMTIGSFTEELIFSLETPILVVPNTFQFSGLNQIVFAIDGQPISSSNTVQMLVGLAGKTEANLHVVHVVQDQNTAGDKLKGIDKYLDQITYDFRSVPAQGSVTKTLDIFCDEQEADLLSMVHRDRGWMINIFHKSTVKEELFHLKTPLLVLPE